MSAKLEWDAPRVVTLMERAVDEGLDAAGIFLVGQISINITNVDLVDTGNLRDSWSAYRIEQGVVRVGSPVEYGVYHEFGTKFMGARPFLRPALFEHKDEIIKAFVDAVQRRLK